MTGCFVNCLPRVYRTNSSIVYFYIQWYIQWYHVVSNVDIWTGPCPQKNNVDGGWPALLFTAVGLDHLKFVGKALIFSFANHLPHVHHYYSKYPDSNRDNSFRRGCTVVHWTIFKWEGLTLDLHRENWLLVNQPLSSSNEERSRHQHCHPGAHRGRDVLLRGTVCWGQIGENITRKS